MLVDKKNIERLIPHRKPFIMIDNLIDVKGDVFKSDFKVSADNYFLIQGKLSPQGMIENIAQTCAAGLAFSKINPIGNNGDGFIASIANLNNCRLPATNDVIHTVVQQKMVFNNMYAFRGSCFIKSELLLECEIKIVEILK